MRCRFCGAEVKEESGVCEYCGSAVEKPAPEEKKERQDRPVKSTVHNVVSVIAKGIVALAGIWAVLIVVVLIVVLNSDSIKNVHQYTEDSNAIYQEPSKQAQEDSARKPKRNAAGLAGIVITCDEDGAASIECEEEYYNRVQILDKELIEWLNDTGRSIDTVGIRFATDKNGDIREIGLLSTDFFILERNGERYTAARDDQIVSFTSAEPLEAGSYYGGYFSYPDMRLYYGEKKSPSAMTYMDLQCEGRESKKEQEYYTEEGIATYRIKTRGKWYYCSREVYDAVQEGDSLEGYQIYDEGELAFLMKE